MNPTPRVVAAVAVLAGALGAQSLQPIVIEGQELPGGGTVTGIRSVFVDAWGAWLVHVTTDHPDAPSVVLRGQGAGVHPPAGPLWKQVGDPVPDPAGAQIAAFDSFTAELFGGVTWNARLRSTPGGSADDQAVYFENKLWVKKGPIASFPQTDWPAGSRWVSFDDVRCSLQSGEALLRGRADDPTVPGRDETFAAVGYLCGTVGMLCDLTRVGQEGWPATGTSQLIEAVRLEPGAGAISPTNRYLVWSCDLDGPVESDACVYRVHDRQPNELLAQEGSQSPVAGRRWGPLDDLGVHVNSSGSWTIRATLDTTDLANDAIIVKDDLAYVREGDTLPAIAPFTFAGFGRGRALLAQGDHVVWFAHWADHGQRAEALFRDDKVLVRTGQTSVGGQLLVGLSSGPDDYSLMPQGDQLVFKGTLEGGREAAFALDVRETP